MTAKVLPFDQAEDAARRYREAYLRDTIEVLRGADSFIVMAFDDKDSMRPMYHCNSQQMALAAAILLHRSACPNMDH